LRDDCIEAASEFQLRMGLTRNDQEAFLIRSRAIASVRYRKFGCSAECVGGRCFWWRFLRKHSLPFLTQRLTLACPSGVGIRLPHSRCGSSSTGIGKTPPPFSPIAKLARGRSAVNHASPRSRLEELRGFSGPFTLAGAPYRRGFAACANAGRAGSSASVLSPMGRELECAIRPLGIDRLATPVIWAVDDCLIGVGPPQSVDRHGQVLKIALCRTLRTPFLVAKR